MGGIFILMSAMKVILWLMLFVLVFFVMRIFKRCCYGSWQSGILCQPRYRSGRIRWCKLCFRELTEESAEDRPAVQKGDPFMEKLLLEACLEMMAIPGLVVGIQDMGAAGLTCSTCETASRGDSGIEIDLDLVLKGRQA